MLVFKLHNIMRSCDGHIDTMMMRTTSVGFSLFVGNRQSSRAVNRLTFGTRIKISSLYYITVINTVTIRFLNLFYIFHVLVLNLLLLYCHHYLYFRFVYTSALLFFKLINYVFITVQSIYMSCI